MSAQTAWVGPQVSATSAGGHVGTARTNPKKTLESRGSVALYSMRDIIILANI